MSSKRILSIGGTSSAEEHEKRYRKQLAQEKRDRLHNERYPSSIILYTGRDGAKAFDDALKGELGSWNNENTSKYFSGCDPYTVKGAAVGDVIP
jgi:hypothetical protein